jgi:hypothetical protein
MTRGHHNADARPHWRTPIEATDLPVEPVEQQGVAMLSSVLRSPRSIHVNVAIMRAFVRLRETLSLHKDLAHKLAELERKIENHDESIRALLEAIRQLRTPPEQPRKEIGFHAKETGARCRIKRKTARQWRPHKDIGTDRMIL